MGSINDKLNKIKLTKSSIKAAIINKGGTVSDTDTFASYSTAIENIPASFNVEDVTFVYTGSVEKSGHVIKNNTLTFTDLDTVSFTVSGSATIQEA